MVTASCVASCKISPGCKGPFSLNCFSNRSTVSFGIRAELRSLSVTMVCIMGMSSGKTYWGRIKIGAARVGLLALSLCCRKRFCSAGVVIALRNVATSCSSCFTVLIQVVGSLCWLRNNEFLFYCYMFVAGIVSQFVVLGLWCA